MYISAYNTNDISLTVGINGFVIRTGLYVLLDPCHRPTVGFCCCLILLKEHTYLYLLLLWLMCEHHGQEFRHLTKQKTL